MKSYQYLVAIVLLLSARSAHTKHHESNRVKKIVHVAFYAAQTAAGCHFFNQFYAKVGSLWPCPVASKICDDPWRAGSEGLASATLLWRGLKGLDKELQISKEFKRKKRLINL